MLSPDPSEFKQRSDPAPAAPPSAARLAAVIRAAREGRDDEALVLLSGPDDPQDAGDSGGGEA